MLLRLWLLESHKSDGQAATDLLQKKKGSKKRWIRSQPPGDKSWQVDAKAKHFVVKTLTEDRIGTLFWRRFIKTLLFKCSQGLLTSITTLLRHLLDGLCLRGGCCHGDCLPTSGGRCGGRCPSQQKGSMTWWPPWLLGWNKLHSLHDHPLLCVPGCQGQGSANTTHFWHIMTFKHWLGFH